MPVSKSERADFVRLVPASLELSALGAGALADFLDPACAARTAASGSAGLVTGSRRRLLERRGSALRYLLPLPGTPTATDPMPEKPRGAGTGWLRVHAYASGSATFAEAFAARTRHPRSTSLAARDWNLVCHLRANGLGAPEPIALLENRHGALKRDSVFVMRELDGFQPAPQWFSAQRSPVQRRLAVRSLAASFRSLFRAGVWLAQLEPNDVWIAQPEASTACAAEELQSMAHISQFARARGFRRQKLPAVAFVRFDGGRILRRIEASRRQWLLERVAGGPDSAPAWLSRREQLTIAASCSTDEPGRPARRPR